MHTTYFPASALSIQHLLQIFFFQEEKGDIFLFAFILSSPGKSKNDFGWPTKLVRSDRMSKLTVLVRKETEVKQFSELMAN